MFWMFWRFLGWILVKLASDYSKRHLLHDSMPFFPLASSFMTSLLWDAQKSNFEKVTYVLRFSFF